MKRLYVVVRRDLPPGLQLAQACHAVREFVDEHPGAEEKIGENLVALNVADELALWRLTERVREQGVPVTLFREPDLGGALTAAAMGSAAQKLLSSLPLALREVKDGRGRVGTESGNERSGSRAAQTRNPTPMISTDGAELGGTVSSA